MTPSESATQPEIANENGVNLSPLETDASGPATFPWSDRPSGSREIVWRHPGNPILGRKPAPGLQGVYNSAVAVYGNSYVGVFRTEDHTRFPHLHVGWSEDALDWQIDPEPLVFGNHQHDPADYAYDPRVVKIDDWYYITWCGGHNGPTISVARTKAFRHFERMENAFLPFNRNGVLFPRRIQGKYLLLSRPSDDGHTAFGDIYVSQSPDMVHWGRHRLVMRSGGEATGQWWQRTKIGAGPIPIETPEGWLMLYHGVMDTCNGFVYSMGAALLDLDEPWRVLYRTNQHLLTPDADYEVSGHVPNVVFPCAALHDESNGRLAIYYGAADTCTCVAYAHLSELIEFTKANSTVF
ncbi:glycoside hydrolase family 130 protein [Botrimarina hoheduenensis]|uniref:Beta-1,4-mannooligosaccharide phosphorylase n=1 Tax=Botrimarina hoheduenensis TaxID=2528000 RepID=A0A5C5WBR6_9BACT|nr:glycoside hydrolase family 130 protein [Botrimarina hoheduenensis]TWT47529.1 Beta-1,4-mannooligosaccharide phosphorylase [Botrimarina hoheduenensis]